MLNIPWLEVKKDYLLGITIENLVVKYDIKNRNSFRAKLSQEGWYQERKQLESEMLSKINVLNTVNQQDIDRINFINEEIDKKIINGIKILDLALAETDLETGKLIPKKNLLNADINCYFRNLLRLQQTQALRYGIVDGKLPLDKMAKEKQFDLKYVDYDEDGEILGINVAAMSDNELKEFLSKTKIDEPSDNNKK